MKSIEEITQFEKVQTQIKGLYNEIGILSKKNPNDAINKFKLKYINQSIKDANDILKNEKPYSDFDIFADEDMPSVSDVVIILEQYYSSLEKIRCANIKYEMGHWYWIINGKISEIETNSSTLK
jgi:hypothetical protein